MKCDKIGTAEEPGSLVKRATRRHWGEQSGHPPLENQTLYPPVRPNLLIGPVVDQAALHGLLKKVRDLGMPLLSVNRIKPGPSNTLPSASLGTGGIGQADVSDVKG